MKTRALIVLMGIFLITTQAFAQPRMITGRVTNDQGSPVAGVSVTVQGTTTRTLTNSAGNYSIEAAMGQVLLFRLIGYAPEERTVSASNVINVELRTVALTLDAMVITALGQTTELRSIGTAQQSLQGTEIVETQRENFINALAGRIAGVDVTSTSGVPGASTSITIRGVSSISSSNQPLFIVDGLPMDNKTLSTASLASGGIAGISFENRGVDFTNRAADLNPDDIESLVVLKGPEAAALYGIDAANGAIVITTKRGKPGVGGLEYSNNFMVATPRGRPEIQRVYGPQASLGSVSYLYWGEPYPAGTQFYDNVDGFFQSAVTQNHALTFSGAAPDNRINYRLSAAMTERKGVVPNDKYDRVNVTGRSGAQVNDWLNADLSMAYTYVDNRQSFKGSGGPLLGLLLWPQTDDAKDYLTPAGNRRRLTSLSAGSEVDNPYFNVNKNFNNSTQNRIIANLGLTIAPFSWGNLRTNIGTDTYTNQNQILRHPESTFGIANNGVIDVANDMTRSSNAQTVLNIFSRPITEDISIGGLIGNQINDLRSTVDASVGRDFLEPNFVSVNNTNLRHSRTSSSQRRLVGLYGQATVDFRRYLYVTVSGRNDWTSTIPVERNSFFYPAISSSFVFTTAFPQLEEFMTGRLRAAYAEVGKDARPYSYRPSLEYKDTPYGGYGYGFWGPNRNLRPEFKTSYELGTDLTFLENRLGIDLTYYHSQTKDQIVDNIRGSYATGFILFNLNGASTRNTGIELTLRGTPVLTPDFSWDFIANFDRSRGKVISLPYELPETYNSDTWLYGNVRNGTAPGLSTRAITGAFYLRNNAGDLLISPTSGLPIRSTDFIDGGYDRQPDFTVGLTNTLRHRRMSLSFLLDIRRGGDVLNATEHFLTARGLTPRTLDREQPRVIDGVLRDGLENSENPTRNTIVVIPSINTSYYVAMSEENFIEKDVNWLRLRDVTVRYNIPDGRFRNASVFLTGTDLFLLTNYSGMDPIVSGNTAATGGSGGAGIDFGNFPMPKTFNFGIRMGL
jgi:TonB-linked SusC/RagA family outer membrane protein